MVDKKTKSKVSIKTQIFAFFAHPFIRAVFLRLWGASLIGGVIFSALAIISFDPFDAGPNSLTPSVSGNWLGAPGAWAADMILQFFGWGVFIWLVPLFMLGGLYIQGKKPRRFWVRFFAGLAGFLVFSISLAYAEKFAVLPVIDNAPARTGVVSTLLMPYLYIENMHAILSYTQKIALLVAGGIISLGFTLLSIGYLRISLSIIHALMRFIMQSLSALSYFGGRFVVYGVLKIYTILRRQEHKKDNDIDEAIPAPTDESPLIDESDIQVEDTLDIEKTPPPIITSGTKDNPPASPSTHTRTRKAQGKQTHKLPPLTLLATPKATGKKALSPRELEDNAHMLETILAEFNVTGAITKIRPGPVVTLYELEPGPGIRSSRIIGLSDDIARSMGAISCRIAPIPGANVIGIEIPNETRAIVLLRELLANDAYKNSRDTLSLALGKDIGGAPIVENLAKMPHLLVAGTTGSGKSVGINTMILSLLYKLTPQQCRLILIDPKILELSIYDNIPHLLTPVVTEPKKAVIALKWVVQEMDNRYRKMAEIKVRNIDGYNTRMREAIEKGETLSQRHHTGFDAETGAAIYEDKEITPEIFPYIVVVIDEMADLMMVAGKDIEIAVQRLAQKARAAGIHMITATQRPSVDVITGTIKANFPSRISFQVTSKIDSRTVLGEQGAEQLLGQGDMLFMGGAGRIERVHGPFVSDEEVEAVVQFLKQQGTPDYLADVTVEKEESGPDAAPSGDTLYDQAVAIVTQDRRASTSYLQRRLQIGYNRAARLIEQMEDQEVVSPPNAAGKRDILVDEH